MTRKIYKVSATGVVTTDHEATLTDSIVAAISAPLSLFSTDKPPLDAQIAAGAAVIWGIGGLLYGERMGHTNAAKGKQPWVGGPVMAY